jgi:hypothetical protein
MSSLRNKRKPIACLVILALSAFTIISAPAHAVMVNTADILKLKQQDLTRERLQMLLDRSEVRKQLVDWGVDPEEAKARVESLTDQEVAKIVARMDQLPAGGDGLGVIVGAAVLIFLVLLITDLTGVTDIFPFIKKADK